MRLIRLLLPVLLLGLAPAAPAGDDIEVNALFYKHAVLTVDGEQITLTAGETRNGIKLINANGERAIVEINGERRRLTVEAGNARKLTSPEEFQRHTDAKSHVIDARAVEQSPDKIVFEVDYYCSEKLGQPVRLIAKTLFRYEDTGAWSHSLTPVRPGRHTATITVGMSDDATDGYLSDAMQFSLSYSRNGTLHETGALVFEFIKEWHRR